MNRYFRCFQHWLIRCSAQSIWLIKTYRWIDVWMFTNDSMRFSTQITWLFKTSRWTDVWMFYSTLFLLRSNAYLKLIDEQMFGCLHKIKSDFLLRSYDCLKPPDEQMFECFTQQYFLLRSNACSKNAMLLKSSLSFLASQYYRCRRLRVVKICSSGGFDQSYTLIRTVVKTSKHLFIHRFWSVICLLVKVKTSKHLFIWMFWLVIRFEQIILSVSVENI